NLDNPTVGDRALIAQMETRTPLTTGDTSNYGFGLVADGYRGARVIGHGGADPGYRSDVKRYPEQGLATVVLCNAATSNPGQLATRVADIYLAGVLPPVPPTPAPQSISIPSDRLRRRAGAYIDRRTMRVVELTMRGGRLMLGREGNTALVPVADDRMRTASDQNVLVFDDAASTFDLIPPAGRRLHFERGTPASATRDLLAAYAGEYLSDELAGAVYTVTAGDSTLTLRTGTSNGITARLVFADTFIGDGDTMQFTRAAGRTHGFDVSNGRVRDVQFVRRASKAP